jgi:hypothetical protein
VRAIAEPQHAQPGVDNLQARLNGG